VNFFLKKEKLEVISFQKHVGFSARQLIFSPFFFVSLFLIFNLSFVYFLFCSFSL